MKKYFDYDDVGLFLMNIGYSDWYPERDNLILCGEYGNSTYFRNRWDSITLSEAKYKKAYLISPVENNDRLWTIKELSKKEIENF